MQLSPEQTSQLDTWFDERWVEAADDVVTDDVLDEIRRQIDLYDPYAIYTKALKLWGDWKAGAAGGRPSTPILDILDEHQRQGYYQALRIIEEESGVMICDGVGLGKSFIAMALMQRFLAEGRNVLLVSPKSIKTSSWDGYLLKYLTDYISPYGNIANHAHTDFGIDPSLDSAHEKLAALLRLHPRTDVVVIDESHNFRSTSANRYVNLFRVLAASGGKPKKVILLTATPINTEYRDLSAQLALITHEGGSIAAYRIDQIRRSAATLDNELRKLPNDNQLTLDLGMTPSACLNNVLEAVAIQRSRKTCQELAKAAGKVLLFPQRETPETIEYGIDPASSRYLDLISIAKLRFVPGLTLIERMRDELAKAEKKKTKVHPAKLAAELMKGIKLAAFLTEQYRKSPIDGTRRYQDEVLLAALVFSNSLKQLESSPPAFQGIIQSLGIGLIARLACVFGEDQAHLWREHIAWVRTELFPAVREPDEEEADSADLPAEIDGREDDQLDRLGAETDAWLGQAIGKRNLSAKLAGFNDEMFNTTRWRDDIISDLGYLREIHEATLAARKQPDPKLDKVGPLIAANAAGGGRVLVFTQSQRTAQYLERELPRYLNNCSVARIDSRIETTRSAILYAFCPGYNPKVTAPSIPEQLEVLVSTDVLSEGVNLQETTAIFNYDIHWNPVRLIQRIGRVDRRLDPAVTPKPHSFKIFNILPPDPINDIIQLIGTVERRTINITKTLGLDAAFFKSTDLAGTLKEFNAVCDGPMTETDIVLTKYAEVSANPDPALIKIIDRLPPGAFGVWDKAPHDGLFALYVMVATARAGDADRRTFKSVIGRPMLVLEKSGNQVPITHEAQILALLGGTTPWERSGTPSDEHTLVSRLKRLRNAVREKFAAVELPATIVPELVCWMELRKERA